MQDSTRPFTLQQMLRRHAPMQEDDKRSRAMAIQQHILDFHEDAEGKAIPDDLDHALNAIFRTEMVEGTQTPAQIEKEIAQYRITVAESPLFQESQDPWEDKEPTNIASIPPRQSFNDILGEDSDKAAMIIRSNIDTERELLLSIQHYAYVYTRNMLGFSPAEIIDEDGQKKDVAKEFKRHLGICKRHICYIAGSGESSPEAAKQLGCALIKIIEARADRLIFTALSNELNDSTHAEKHVAEAARSTFPRM